MFLFFYTTCFYTSVSYHALLLYHLCTNTFHDADDIIKFLKILTSVPHVSPAEGFTKHEIV